MNIARHTAACGWRLDQRRGDVSRRITDSEDALPVPGPITAPWGAHRMLCPDRCREQMCDAEPDVLEDMEALTET